MITRPSYVRTRQLELGSVRIPGGLSQIWTNQGLTSQVNLSEETVINRKVMTDVVTPGFQQLKSKGRFINNPASAVTTEYTGGTCGRWLAYFVKGTSFSSGAISENGYKDKFGGLQSVPVPYITDIDGMRALAQTAALAGVEKPSMQSLVSVAESVKTFRMLVSPMRTLAKLAKAQRDIYDRRTFASKVNAEVKASQHAGNVRRAVYFMKELKKITNLNQKQKAYVSRYAASADVLSGTVLSLNLGWRPLLMEIDALLTKIPKLEQQEILSSRKLEEDKGSSITLESFEDGWATWQLRKEVSETSYIRASVFYRDKFQPTQHFGTRVSDIPEALWELVPFSFLVDYVLNIEQVIGAWRAMLSADVVGVCTKMQVNQTIDREVISMVPKYSATYTSYAVVSHSFEPEKMSHEAWTRSPAVWSAQFAFRDKLLGRPPAQLQNVLSLLTQELLSATKGKRAFY